jgi:drug/metabolite transporter (DMT)-like permease
MTIVAGLAAVGAAVFWLDVAWSSFFGVRDLANPGLGIFATLLAVTPWAAGFFAYRFLSREGADRPHQFFGIALALGAGSLFALFFAGLGASI